jgi:hypothetical protein
MLRSSREREKLQQEQSIRLIYYNTCLIFCSLYCNLTFPFLRWLISCNALPLLVSGFCLVIKFGWRCLYTVVLYLMF